MAEILSFLEFELNTASPKATSSDDVKKQKGVAFYYDDYSTLGYISNGNEITNLLIGQFIQTYGLSVQSINLKNPAEQPLTLNVGTYDSEDPYYYGTLTTQNGEKIADAQMLFNTNYEEKDSENALKQIEEAFKTLQTKSPAKFELANRILAEVEKKHKELYLTVPQIRTQQPSKVLKELEVSDDEIFFLNLENAANLCY